MNIGKIESRNTYPTSFGAIKVAQITSLMDKNDITQIYKIEKNKDCDFCNDLISSLLQSDVNRMQVSSPNIKLFLRHAFNSFNVSDYSAIGVKRNKPFGLISINSPKDANEVHLGYLATWKTPDLVKVKDGGRNLINFLFNIFQDKKYINTTPSFNSELFYSKFGFDYEDEFERNQMTISSADIKKQLQVFSKNFVFENLDNQPSETLTKFITLV